uniref:Uncharacterized protein n=1 Tax=Arundo donax TaxID=35708 RepID=A0A0A8XRV1_ARUDO
MPRDLEISNFYSTWQKTKARKGRQQANHLAYIAHIHLGRQKLAELSGLQLLMNYAPAALSSFSENWKLASLGLQSS